MQPIIAAPAATSVDREAPHDHTTAAPPDPPAAPRRRRRWWGRPDTAFLEGPAGNEHASRWQAACGQGG